MISIKDDSRKVESGDTFIAIIGIDVDGHDYIDKALENGASKIIVSREVDYDVETIVVSDTRKYLVDYLYDTYYEKIKDIKLIGITGTNGKTTTAVLIHDTLNKLNKKCAYIGTLGFYLDDKIIETNNTSPGILEMYNLLLMCLYKDIEYVVIEASSQGLHMNRLARLKFDYGMFTNLTQDHLDYHGSFENYIDAKKILFENLRGIAIINNDDESCSNFLLEKNINKTYSIDNNSDYKVIDYKILNSKTEFNIKIDEKVYFIETKLLGKHNIYNMMLLISFLMEEGYKFEEFKDIVESLTPPPGRMEVIPWGSRSIIVDYAHTPDAILNVLNAVKEIATGKVITIVGCGGDRDRKKRPIMSKIACRLSDFVIITSDNPRTEDPDQIFADMLEGLEFDNYEKQENRDKAIKYGVSKMKENDILMILGKGHEDYQILGTRKIHFSDKEKAIKYIEEMK